MGRRTKFNQACSPSTLYNFLLYILNFLPSEITFNMIRCCAQFWPYHPRYILLYLFRRSNNLQGDRTEIKSGQEFWVAFRWLVWEIQVECILFFAPFLIFELFWIRYANRNPSICQNFSIWGEILYMGNILIYSNYFTLNSTKMHKLLWLYSNFIILYL